MSDCEELDLKVSTSFFHFVETLNTFLTFDAFTIFEFLALFFFFVFSDDDNDDDDDNDQMGEGNETKYIMI